MPHAQKWLDKNYPKESRTSITKLDISFQNLKGSLELKGFVNLEQLDCSNNRINKIDLSECVKLTELNCSLNYEFSELDISKLSQLTKLDCSWAGILGHLWLSDCPKLVELDCTGNWLREVDISKLSYLAKLDCSYNELTDFDFSSLDPEKIVEIDLSNNDFTERKLSCFTRFTNLETLHIGTSSIK
jgi:Leucine-rich repeat (LRR) protein